MTIYVIEAAIYVEGEGPEEIAAEMSYGLEGALSGFRVAEVLAADVTLIRQATEQEVEERGLTE